MEWDISAQIAMSIFKCYKLGLTAGREQGKRVLQSEPSRVSGRPQAGVGKWQDLHKPFLFVALKHHPHPWRDRLDIGDDLTEALHLQQLQPLDKLDELVVRVVVHVLQAAGKEACKGLY